MRLYIGIETKAREFDAKLLLACFAAEAGYDVVLGRQKFFLRNLHKMPRGILLNKSISPRKAMKYEHYKKLGYSVVAYDEEGLAPFNADEYQKRRIAVDSLKPLDYFFAWGQWQTDVIAEKADAEIMQKVMQVGNPRTDLTRREVRDFYNDYAQALKKRYGKFILINTNFSFYNHFSGRDFEKILQQKTKAGKVADDEQRAYYRRVSEHKKVLFHAFAEMTHHIRKRFPDAAVVLRPHPSEDHDYWREILAEETNVHVVYEGGVLPWILASDVMIHNSCTTGIEAFLLEQPVLAYRPVVADELECSLPNVLSEQVFTLEELLRRIAHYVEAPSKAYYPMDAEKKDIASQYLISLDGQLACERIVSDLNNIAIPQMSLAIKGYQWLTNMRQIKQAVLKVFRQPGADQQKKQAYTDQKFPGISVAEVEEATGKFCEVTGRFHDLRIVRLEKNLIQISPK